MLSNALDEFNLNLGLNNSNQKREETNLIKNNNFIDKIY